MKPVYDEYSFKWTVKNVGTFDTVQEAWDAIRECEKNKMMTFMVSRKMHADLQRVARSRRISVSELIRRAIEKEVQNDG